MILERIEIIVDECNDDIPCWNSNGINVQSFNEGNTFKIEVTSKNMKDFPIGRDIVIKGAIDFEHNPIQGEVFEC